MQLPIHRTSSLTSEQEAMLLSYQEKWRRVIISTNKIDQEITLATINSIYAQLTLSLPKTYFFESPHAAVEFILSQELSQFFYMPITKAWVRLRKILSKGIYNSVERQLWQSLCSWLDNQIDFVTPENMSPWGVEPIPSPNPLAGGRHYFVERLNQFGHSFALPEFWSLCSAWFDFCFSELGCEFDPQIWQLYQLLMQNSGWLFADLGICIISERPIHLLFDSQQQLHAEGQPALKFADGYHLYFCHGVNTNFL